LPDSAAGGAESKAYSRGGFLPVSGEGARNKRFEELPGYRPRVLTGIIKGRWEKGYYVWAFEPPRITGKKQTF